MQDILKTFDQYLENSGKWVQAEVFYNGCEFNDIQTDEETLSLSSNVVLASTNENVQTKLWIDDKLEFQFDCSCKRKKPCMHAYGLYLYAKRNDKLKAFESKITSIPRLSLEELAAKENLKKITEVQYQIKEKTEEESEERYYFDCSLIDVDGNEYSTIYIQQNMKIMEEYCIFYSLDNQGFYIENNQMMKKVLMVILVDKYYSKSDAAYTKYLIDRHLKNIKPR